VRYDTAIRAEEADIAAPNSVEDYLAPLPEEQRAALEKLRKTIKAAAPKATETISYQMPAFKQDGRFLVSYAAFKDHCSLYPASYAVMEALGDDLEPYFSGKGTLRFQADRPIPAALVKKIVELRLEENAARSRPG
jgi:uncharacterized protein YdhG (YjbR/CyaY superfamily)